jgi:hypothetical protein
MLRDFSVALLFVGGLFLGGALGFVYHRSASGALSKSLADREAEVERLSASLATEQERAKVATEQAAASQDKMSRELDVLRLELAEQTALVARQRDRIAALEAKRPAGEPNPADLEASDPSNKEDGLVRGGKFVYRHVKLQPSNGELEIAGEMENRTNKRYRQVIFHVELFDEQLKPIETIAVTMMNLSPGETKPFKEYTLADKPMMIRAVSSFRITAALVDGEFAP